MMPGGEFRGMALQVHVGDMDRARAFYTSLFARPPDFAPHEDFQEWQVSAGTEVWWQIVGVPTDVLSPLRSRIRFMVDDVEAAAEQVRAELGVHASAVTELPGVVAFTDFEDPWGNRLGLYHDIVPSGQQREPGGSVRDESMFVRSRHRDGGEDRT